MLKVLMVVSTTIAFAQVSAPVKATDKLPWPSLSSLYYDYKARGAMKDKNPEIAMEYELKILENDPSSMQTHSNLGVIFDHLQKKDESGQSFDLALNLLERYKEQLSPGDVFQIYYNLGLRYHNGKNTELALEFYQKALEINPASIETKHNIELLIQQQQGGGGDGKSDKKDQEGKGDQNQDPKDGEDKEQQNKEQEKDRQQNSKYKPRPFQGDQLSEADVKKILGELSQQDKKIRANYNKKDRKEDKNAKDW
ncbi:MAG: tetratricopeptide repeat protein [Bdellovibrionota bacterium]